MAISTTLKAIADPLRRSILELLRKEPLSAGTIAEHFPELTQAAVSYHLKLLKQAGLITERRAKNFIYYDLNASVFEEVLTWIYDLGLGGKEDDK